MFLMHTLYYLYLNFENKHSCIELYNLYPTTNKWDLIIYSPLQDERKLKATF